MLSHEGRQNLEAMREMVRSGNPPRSPGWDKNDMKTYDQGFVYILDHSQNYLDMPNQTPKQQQHDERCRDMAEFFETKTRYEVTYVNFTRNNTPAEWNQYWDDELQAKTEDDLIIIYFHGRAGDQNMQYKWRFQRGFEVNAYDFIAKINSGSADCHFFLDCIFYTRMVRGLKWKLDTTEMTEFIISPMQVQALNGNAVDHEGDWSKAFVRNMNRFVTGEAQFPKLGVALKTISQIMQKDHSIFYNQGSRFALERRVDDPGDIRRLVCDPVMVWSTGEYEFFGKRLGGKPVVEEEPVLEAQPQDEGVGEDFDPAEQFVLDQMARDQDIADGFGDDGSDGDNDEDGDLLM